MICKKRIVAEVSKSWPEQAPGLLSERFEQVIKINAEREYRLESWQYQKIFVPGPGGAGMSETIIAVFVK